MSPFLIETLGAGGDKTGFTCGVEQLDRYFREQASQDVRRRVAACFVAIDSANSKVAGYYTLSAGSVALSDLPPTIARRLPRYPAVPIARLGRLAVDTDYKGQKLGAALLWDAVMRASRSDLMCFALLVDAKDDQAEAFYTHHGFVQLTPRVLMLPFGKDHI